MYLFYLLVAYGLCFALQHKVSFLHGKWSWLDEMLHCTFCTGAHCGWLTWLLVWGVQGEPPASGTAIIPSLWMWCLASAAWCYFLDAVASYLESNTGGEA